MDTIDTSDIFDNDKIVSLICLGAATAANCIPCFEHLYEKAHLAGLTEKEIQGAAQLASMVKKGAHLAMQSSIDELMGTAPESRVELPKQPCGCSAADATGSCVG